MVKGCDLLFTVYFACTMPKNIASPHKYINKNMSLCISACVWSHHRTQMSGEDQVTVNPQRKVRRGKGEANVEMECHCVSPSLARVATRSHPAVV